MFLKIPQPLRHNAKCYNYILGLISAIGKDFCSGPSSVIEFVPFFRPANSTHDSTALLRLGFYQNELTYKLFVVYGVWIKNKF